MCSCRKKSPVEPSPPLPQFSIQLSSGGDDRVQIASRSDCILHINDRTLKMSGGSKAFAHQPEALKLIESGAPIWIVA